MNDKWKDIVKAVAPSLATLFGGPFAGVAVKALSEKLLGKSEGTETEVAAAISAMSPADYVKLREVEADLKKSLANAGIKIEEIAASDRDSARKREIAVHDKIPGLLAIAITLGFFGTLYYLANHPIDQNNQYLLLMVGTLSTAWGGVLAYYFGTTSGSAFKTKLLAEKGQV